MDHMHYVRDPIALPQEGSLQFDDDTKVEILIKEIYKPAILRYIALVNLELKTQGRGELKFVIGGGEAFNYYIAPTKQTEVFKTHDYDLRLYMDQPASNVLFSNKAAEQELVQSCRHFAEGLAAFLNEYMAKIPNVSALFKEYNVAMSDFRPTTSSFLQKVEYYFTYRSSNGYEKKSHDSICDITPHIPSKIKTYGAREHSIEELYQFYTTPDGHKVESRHGFSKAPLLYVRDNDDPKYPIYYVTLGYLLWDAVRMINWTLDAMKQQPGPPENPRRYKLVRYLQKYQGLLLALNSPKKYMRCGNSFIKDIMAKCTLDDRELRERRCTVKTGTKSEEYDKDELIELAFTIGVFPNTPYWQEFMQNRTLEDLCSILQLVQWSPTPEMVNEAIKPLYVGGRSYQPPSSFKELKAVHQSKQQDVQQILEYQQKMEAQRQAEIQAQLEYQQQRQAMYQAPPNKQWQW